MTFLTCTLQGEFTLNKITGKGLYKWGDGSSYEGEVQNGLRHGYGTFRCPGNKMSYTGEWVMGKRQGKVGSGFLQLKQINRKQKYVRESTNLSIIFKNLKLFFHF